MNLVVNIHASCVRLGRAGAAFGAPANAGILLLGKSGAGKSSLALRLIAAGAKLVADDRVELFVRRGRLMARAVPSLSGFLEVRGVGIVELDFAAQTPISLVVDLTDGTIARLPRARIYEAPRKLLLSRANCPPMIALKGTDVDAPAKIAVAVAAFAKKLFRSCAKV